MIRKTGLLLLALMAILIIFNGCISTGTKKTEWKPTEAVKKPPFIHTVKFPGETFPIISQWYTGDKNNWEVLADANLNLDYDHMAPGSRIYIPENLLKTTDPLTEDYIDAYNKKNKPKVTVENKKPVSKPKTPPKKDEDLDLFGPK